MRKLRYILSILVILISMEAYAQSGEVVLQLDATSVSNKVARLQWTSYVDNNQETKLILYRRIQGEPGFTNLGLVVVSTPQIYFDTLPRMLCGDTVVYFLANGWPYYEISSNRVSMLMTDVPTNPCELKVASVDEESQKIVLSWYESPDFDIKGYYLCRGNPCLDFDTIWGRENTSYTCDQLPSTEVSTFRLLAFDSCMNPSPLTDNYNNIVLKLESEDCQPWAKASWNKYINMPNGLSGYQVMVRYGDEVEWEQVDFIASNAPPQSLIQIPESATRITVKIVAQDISHTLSASSNIVSYDISTVDTAEFLYISSASVNGEGNQVKLDLYVDSDYQTDKYTLYRGINNQELTKLTTIPYSADEHFSYTDRGVDAVSNTYSYKLSALDGCGRNEKFSNVVRTIAPQLSSNENIVSLQWEPYQGWEGRPQYEVYRRIGEQPWVSLGRVMQCNYIDHTASLDDLNEALMYRVVAYEPVVSNYGFADSAKSAYIPYRCEGYAVFPNAIIPDSQENNLFGPVHAFIEDYSLYIYNRAGELIFNTTDPDMKWDGTFYGNPVPMGAYAYIANCRFVDQQQKQYIGTVLVIR